MSKVSFIELMKTPLHQVLSTLMSPLGSVAADMDSDSELTLILSVVFIMCFFYMSFSCVLIQI